MNGRWSHRSQHLETIGVGLGQEGLHATHRTVQTCHSPRGRKMQFGSFQELPAGEARLVPSHKGLCRDRIRTAQENSAGRRRRQCHSIRPLAQCFTRCAKIGS